jgi:hypothetical protein
MSKQELVPTGAMDYAAYADGILEYDIETQVVLNDEHAIAFACEVRVRGDHTEPRKPGEPADLHLKFIQELRGAFHAVAAHIVEDLFEIAHRSGKIYELNAFGHGGAAGEL